MERKYDLEERTYKFAVSIRGFVKIVPKSPANLEDTRQLIRSSGSIGANYIEANGSLGKKDFLMRIRICLKECRESGYWLKILGKMNGERFQKEASDLYQESLELTKIFHSILKKST